MDFKRNEQFEQAYEEIYKPIIRRPFPMGANGKYLYKEIQDASLLWEKAVKTVNFQQEIKIGDFVYPLNSRDVLASGCRIYQYAVVVSLEPFQLISEDGDMHWCSTVKKEDFKVLKSNTELPELVKQRLERIRFLEEKYCLWAVNIPEEPDSDKILYPIPSKELGEQVVQRLRKEAIQTFETVGECIANCVTLEKWDGAEYEHKEYLISNLNWWENVTFLDGEVK